MSSAASCASRTNADAHSSRDRNDMFELSHRLIGIYKTSNQTQSASSPFCRFSLLHRGVLISVAFCQVSQSTIARSTPRPPTESARPPPSAPCNRDTLPGFKFQSLLYPTLSTFAHLTCIVGFSSRGLPGYNVNCCTCKVHVVKLPFSAYLCYRIGFLVLF